MKEFIITAFGESHRVFISLGRYASNNRKMITLIDAEDGMPYATASINLPDVLLMDDEIAIKDYSENEGMFRFLLDNNIITDTGKEVQSGFVTVPIGFLNPESEWGTVPNLYSENEPQYEQTNQLDPYPDEWDMNTHKGMWIINGYKIWAHSYREAQELLSTIESF